MRQLVDLIPQKKLIEWKRVTQLLQQMPDYITSGCVKALFVEW